MAPDSMEARFVDAHLSSLTRPGKGGPYGPETVDQLREFFSFALLAESLASLLRLIDALPTTPPPRVRISRELTLELHEEPPCGNDDESVLVIRDVTAIQA